MIVLILKSCAFIFFTEARNYKSRDESTCVYFAAVLRPEGLTATKLEVCKSAMAEAAKVCRE